MLKLLITSNNARSLTSSKFLLFIKKASGINFVTIIHAGLIMRPNFFFSVKYSCISLCCRNN